jgi:hypothetical protein
MQLRRQELPQASNRHAVNGWLLFSIIDSSDTKREIERDRDGSQEARAQWMVARTVSRGVDLKRREAMYHQVVGLPRHKKSRKHTDLDKVNALLLRVRKEHW